MQMQMQAGCAEFVEMRVYNPTKQAQDQDPQGTFIRKWLPELRNVPLQYLHEPGRMPKAVQRQAGCVLGVSYPRPIVEHQPAYDRAKHMLQERRNAMGMSRAGSSKVGDGGLSARKRSFGAAASGSADLRDLFAKRCASNDDRESCAAAGGEVCAAAPAAGAPPTPAPQPETSQASALGVQQERHGVQQVIDYARDREKHTQAQLMAAGFPPDLARRAASAYPCDAERAADWILSSNEW